MGHGIGLRVNAPRGTDFEQPRMDEGIAPFTPFLDGPPVYPERLDWYTVVLERLAWTGNKLDACMHARMGRSTVYRALDDDPVFRAEWEYAHEYYRHRLRSGNVHLSRVTGNPVGYIVENKAEWPHLYVEKNLSVSISATVSLEGADALTLLQGMLGEASGATQQLLSAPRALPAQRETA